MLVAARRKENEVETLLAENLKSYDHTSTYSIYKTIMLCARKKQQVIQYKTIGWTSNVAQLQQKEIQTLYISSVLKKSGGISSEENWAPIS